MRKEWIEAIKHRRWDEFERLSKWEPEQLLCDTIAELGRGFTDKADRKALKKILWILDKAGFRPTSVNEAEPTDVTKAEPIQVGFMMSADAMGDTPITFGMQQGIKFRWLTAYVHETRGITRASDDSMSIEEGQKRIDRLRTAEALPFLSGEIEPQFALWRIKRALAKNRPGTIPEALAYWRTVVDKANVAKHPADSLKAAKSKAVDRSENILLMDCTLSWRIELGAATPVLESMYQAQQANQGADEEAQSAAIKEAGAQARKAIFTTDLQAEHVMRLRDLAFLMNQKGDEKFGLVLSAADELEKKGIDSEYAKGLVDKTVVVYVETMKRSDKEATAR